MAARARMRAEAARAQADQLAARAEAARRDTLGPPRE
jgi:hypothetical protein